VKFILWHQTFVEIKRWILDGNMGESSGVRSETAAERLNPWNFIFMAAVVLHSKEFLRFLIRESSGEPLKFVASFKMKGARGLRRAPHIPYPLCKRKEN
jgi:hypothetical protein